MRVLTLCGCVEVEITEKKMDGNYAVAKTDEVKNAKMTAANATIAA